MLEISYKLMAIIAFILIFTTFSVEILYDGSASATLFPGQFVADKADFKISFDTFLQFNWEIAYERLEDGDPNGPAYQSMGWAMHQDVQHHIRQARNVNNDLFDEYSGGPDWFQNDPYLRQGGLVIGALATQPAAVIENAYEHYLRLHSLTIDNTTGLSTIRPIEKNWLDEVIDSALMIPEGIASMIDVATFNFKDKYGNEQIPNDVRAILAVIMAPLWIIMFIGILPYIIAAVDAFAKVLDAIIPF